MSEAKIETRFLPLIKSGLQLREKTLESSLQNYSDELKALEKKHKLSAAKFIKKFNKGKLGDKEEWFDWLFAFKAVENAKEKLKLLKRLHL